LRAVLSSIEMFEFEMFSTSVQLPECLQMLLQQGLLCLLGDCHTPLPDVLDRP
jgi:hypothetical protein